MQGFGKILTAVYYQIIRLRATDWLRVLSWLRVTEGIRVGTMSAHPNQSELSHLDFYSVGYRVIKYTTTKPYLTANSLIILENAKNKYNVVMYFINKNSIININYFGLRQQGKGCFHHFYGRQAPGAYNN